MPITLYRDTTYTLNGLIETIRRGEIGLPNIQRPFVWKPAQVRELFDSTYKGTLSAICSSGPREQMRRGARSAARRRRRRRAS
jgi:hypothetical protein